MLPAYLLFQHIHHVLTFPHVPLHHIHTPEAWEAYTLVEPGFKILETYSWSSSTPRATARCIRARRTFVLDPLRPQAMSAGDATGALGPSDHGHCDPQQAANRQRGVQADDPRRHVFYSKGPRPEFFGILESCHPIRRTRALNPRRRGSAGHT